MRIKEIKSNTSFRARGCNPLSYRLINKPCNFIIPFVFAFILLFTGCPMNVGQCTYGKIPDQHGKVIITSIEKTYSNNQLNYRIKVDGFFKREFIYSSEDFQKKFTSKGYMTGSELEGMISSGGPCPPMYRISD